MVAENHVHQQIEEGKTIRVALRLTRQQAEQLDSAIAITGQSKTEFISQAIAERAAVLLREQRVLELTDRDMDALLSAIEAPGAPNDAMLRGLATLRAHRAHE
jgi:uncharacterized protein (DUF1778 family)